MNDPITSFCIFAKGSSQAREVQKPRSKARAKFPKNIPVFCKNVQSTV